MNFDDGRADHPTSAADVNAKIMQNASQKMSKKDDKSSGKLDKEILSNIEKALKATAEGSEFAYDELDIILYS